MAGWMSPRQARRTGDRNEGRIPRSLRRGCSGASRAPPDRVIQARQIGRELPPILQGPAREKRIKEGQTRGAGRLVLLASQPGDPQEANPSVGGIRAPSDQALAFQPCYLAAGGRDVHLERLPQGRDSQWPAPLQFAKEEIRGSVEHLRFSLFTRGLGPPDQQRDLMLDQTHALSCRRLGVLYCLHGSSLAAAPWLDLTLAVYANKVV